MANKHNIFKLDSNEMQIEMKYCLTCKIAYINFLFIKNVSTIMSDVGRVKGNGCS